MAQAAEKVWSNRERERARGKCCAMGMDMGIGTQGSAECEVNKCDDLKKVVYKQRKYLTSLFGLFRLMCATQNVLWAVAFWIKIHARKCSYAKKRLWAGEEEIYKDDRLFVVRFFLSTVFRLHVFLLLLRCLLFLTISFTFLNRQLGKQEQKLWAWLHTKTNCGGFPYFLCCVLTGAG